MKLDLKGKRRNKMNQVHQVHQHLHKHHSDKHHPSMSSSTITTTVMIDDNDKHDNNTNNNNITSSITGKDKHAEEHKSLIQDSAKEKDKENEKEQQFSFNNSKAFKFKINPWSDSTKSAFAVILYGSVSLCQTIFNKKVMTTYNFEASNVLLFCQMIVSITTLHFLKYMKILNIQTNLTYSIIKKLMPLSVCYVVNVLLGLDSLKSLNIPMYSALKRLVAVIILVMEYLILNKVSPPRVVMSVMVMVMGAVIAGMTDMTFNALGYSLVLTSCFFQATYLVYVKKTARDLSTYDMLYYNSALSLPFITVLMLIFGEVPYVMTYPQIHDPMFQLYFILSVFIGFLLNFCIFFCTSVNSALTTSVTGQIKNIASTVIGAIIFKDIVIHPYNIIGLAINMIGSIWYSALKLGS